MSFQQPKHYTSLPFRHLVSPSVAYEPEVAEATDALAAMTINAPGNTDTHFHPQSNSTLINPLESIRLPVIRTLVESLINGHQATHGISLYPDFAGYTLTRLNEWTPPTNNPRVFYETLIPYSISAPAVSVDVAIGWATLRMSWCGEAKQLTLEMNAYASKAGPLFGTKFCEGEKVQDPELRILGYLVGSSVCEGGMV